MNVTDLVLLVPIAIGTWKGYQKGLLLEVVSLLALVAGILGALKLHHWGMEHLLPLLHIGIQGIAPYVVFVLLFIGLVLGIHVLGKVAKTAIGFTPLGFFDNIGGAITGAIKWFFALSLFIWATEMAGINLASGATSDSWLHPMLVKAGPKAISGISYVLPFVKTWLLEAKAALAA